ncbi:hypothetical protein [Streptomyces coryli]|uniref:hypothetical protein n=1 Tax=Streptomyces coryli TaxID=1128680 RepID=UPI0019D053B3|nr:hypothetical protein [Streptomyces coryli]
MARNKDRNWLLAVILHSCAKHAEGAKLSDLEQSIVTAFRKNGFTDAQIKSHGQVDQRIPQDLRNELFPAKFAQLDVKQSYTLADLGRDAPDLVRTTLAMPTVTQIDVPAIHQGTATLADFPLPSRSVLREHAAAMLVALESDEPTAAAAAAGRYTIKASSFHCTDRQTDSVFGPANEPYFIFGSLGGGIAVTTQSRVFDDVDNGETRTFSSTDGCIWGQNCAAQALPTGEIGSLVSLFEHDSGDPSEIRAGVAVAFAAAAGILVATGVAAWVGAVVAGVGATIQWLIGFMEDDHIADNTFVFTGSVVAKQIPNVGSSFNVVRRFTDGDGDYSLTLKVTHVS